MMLKYAYRMNGTAAAGQTWETRGTIELPPGTFPLSAELALRETLLKITNGEAVFGSPGVDQ
jgi:hypothetical protein